MHHNCCSRRVEGFGYLLVERGGKQGGEGGSSVSGRGARELSNWRVVLASNRRHSSVEHCSFVYSANLCSFYSSAEFANRITRARIAALARDASANRLDYFRRIPAILLLSGCMGYAADGSLGRSSET